MSRLHAPRARMRPGSTLAAIYLAVLLLATSLMVATFLHLGRTSGSAEYRLTRPQTSWVPLPQSRERPFAKLEVTGDRP